MQKPYISPIYTTYVKTEPEESEGLDGTNFQFFLNLRQDFRADFASGLLRPVHMAPRIAAMVTTASNAILEDTKSRNINSVTAELCKGDKSNPISVAEAMAFIWVYVGTVEAVTKRSRPIWVTQALDGQITYLFKQAVSVDKEKNLPHIAHLWRKVQQCHPPESGFPSHVRMFIQTYGDVDLDMVPKPEGGMEQLFEEMSSFPGDWKRNPSEYDEDWKVDTKAVKKMESESVKTPVKEEVDASFLKNDKDCEEPVQKMEAEPVETPVSPVKEEVDDSLLKKQPQDGSDPYFDQKISPPSDEDNLTPEAITKPDSPPTLDCVDSPQEIAPVIKAEKDDESIVPAVKPENVETASTSEQRKSKDFAGLSNINNAILPLQSVYWDFILIRTSPGEYIRVKSSLFPASWSARKLLSEPPRKRSKPNNPEDDDEPVPEVAQTLTDCTETVLRVDFTPEEYIEQTTAANYYAQGVKLIDDVRRVVFYHKMMINPSDIKKEPV